MRGPIKHTRRLAVLLIAMALLTTNCAPVRPPETPAGPSFSILTYNIYYDPALSGDSVKAIAAADADIVCLQEVSPEWVAILRRSLATQYPHMLIDTNPGTSGMATLSKFPFRATSKHAPPPGGWFPAGIVTADTPLGPVQVLNAHLRPRISYSGSAIIGHFTIEKMHTKEIEHYWKLLDPAMPIVVVGDFNESDSGKAIGWLEDHGCRNALPQFDRKSDTWHGKVYGISVSYRGDHILHGPGLHAFSAKVIKDGKSDHLPVHAVIGRPPEAGAAGR